jgi:hypothetical protein
MRPVGLGPMPDDIDSPEGLAWARARLGLSPLPDPPKPPSPPTLVELETELTEAMAALKSATTAAANAADELSSAVSAHGWARDAFEAHDDETTRARVQSAKAEVDTETLSRERAERLKNAAAGRVTKIQTSIDALRKRALEKAADAELAEIVEKSRAEIYRSVGSLVRACRQYHGALKATSPRVLLEVLSPAFRGALRAYDGVEVAERLAEAITHRLYPDGGGETYRNPPVL